MRWSGWAMATSIASLIAIACGGSTPSPTTHDGGEQDAAALDAAPSSGDDASTDGPQQPMTCVPLSCFGLNCECGPCVITFCGAGTMDCGGCEAGAVCEANHCVAGSTADARTD